jgi:hypothetical protein
MVATTIKRKRSFLFLFFLFFFFVFFFFVFSFITVSYWGIVSNVCVSKREERREERERPDRHTEVSPTQQEELFCAAPELQSNPDVED